MLKKRLIFTLLYDQGWFMLSRNFRLQRVGNIDWLRKNYNFSNVSFCIDELIILDVSRGPRDQDKFCEHVKAMTEGSFVPIAAGGGVTSRAHAHKLLRSGADKIVVNSLLSTDPDLVRELASIYGRQCIVGSVDAKLVEGRYKAFTHNGEAATGSALSEWLTRLASLPVGELYLNSMDRDGTGQGYQLDLLAQVPSTMTVPIILAGGAGKPSHLENALRDPRVDAAATAHLFNFVGDGLSNARRHLIASGLIMAQWDRDLAKSLAGMLRNH